MKNLLLTITLLLSINLFAQNQIKYYPSGNLKEQATFVDGKYKLDLLRYYPNGNISYKGFFNQEGKEEGVIQYFYQNGQVEFEYIAIAGNPIGEGYYYFENGDVKKVVVYKQPTDEESSLTINQSENINSNN